MPPGKTGGSSTPSSSSVQPGAGGICRSWSVRFGHGRISLPSMHWWCGGVRRSYTFRMRPTARQHIALQACVDGHRELYIAALQERRDAWRHSRARITYGDQSAQLKDIRRIRPDVAVWSFSSQQATLRRLNRAFDGFFRRVKAGATPGYPRFKGKGRFDSVEWPKDGDGTRWHPETNRVYLQGIGEVAVSTHREVVGRVKTIQVRRQGRRWMLILSCDDVPANPLPATGRRVGIDVGITSFISTSEGIHVDNPRWSRSGAVTTSVGPSLSSTPLVPLPLITASPTRKMS